jgi:multiple sugar transport system permease protein
MNPTKNLTYITAYIFVAIGAVIMLAPFYFMFVFATHTRAEIFQLPPPFWFGDAFLSNMNLLMERIPLWHSLGVSFYIASLGTILTLIVCSLGGYAFAMYEFRFKRLMFALVIATILLPPFMTMIPSFMVIDALQWFNQPRALYIPAAANAFGIFLMRQYILSAVPKDLLDAARIDGCSEFRIYWNIVLPLIKPALGTLGLVSFVGSWNSFINPLIVMQSMDMYTLPLAIRAIQSPVNTEWGAVMAGTALSVMPLLIMFVFASKRFIEGLTAGATKG